MENEDNVFNATEELQLKKTFIYYFFKKLSLKLSRAYNICLKKCMFKDDYLKGDSIHHTVYSCIKNCSVKVNFFFLQN